MREELVAIKEQFATPRRTQILDNEFEQDIEDLIQREDMVVTVRMAATSSGCRCRPIAPSAAAARAVRAWLRARTISSRICSSPTPTRRSCSFQPRHCLQAEGLASAPGHAAGARQGLRQPAAAGRRRDDLTVLPMPEDEASWSTLDVMFATARGEVRRNELSDFVNVNQRQDRHEVRGRGCRRPADRRGHLHRGAGRAAGDRQGRAIRFPVEKCGSSRAAPPPACAASPWPRVTR